MAGACLISFTTGVQEPEERQEFPVCIGCKVGSLRRWSVNGSLIQLDSQAVDVN